MIGLHYMSYSPAQAQQHQEKAGNGDGRRQVDESTGRQQVASGRLDNCGADAGRFIRVAAQIAQPIVSSVPKCRNPKPRSHPFDSLEEPEHQHWRPLMMVAPDEQRARQRQDASRQRARPARGDQVLLIVNDDHVKGGGVPVIGRRLPSKSAGARSSSFSRIAGHLDRQDAGPDLGQFVRPPPMAPSNLTPAGSPVVGRRSRRIQQQHQQAALYRVESHDIVAVRRRQDSRPASNNKKPATFNSGCAHSTDPSGRQIQALGQLHQQPVSSSSSNNLTRPHHQHQPAMSLLSLTASDEHLAPVGGPRAYSHQQQDPVLLQYCQLNEAPPRRKATSSSRLLAPASPCSAFCQASIGAVYCRDACCQAQRRPDPDPCDSPPCQMPCCQLPVMLAEQRRQASSRSTMHLHRHSSDEQLARLAQTKPQGNSSSSSSYHHSCQANGSPALAGHQQPAALVTSGAYRRSSSCHRPPRVRPEALTDHQHHHSHKIAPPVPTKPANYTLVASNQTPPISFSSSASSLVGSRPQHQSSVSRHHPDTKQQHEREAAAVTQMYESLASELKAKLSDPRAAPILLPPKDYDTLSRRQGKLTGIELRRSTNPQLVGPLTGGLAATGRLVSRGNSSIAEETSSGERIEAANRTETAATSSSAWSPASSQTDEVTSRSGDLQRSRSNSSSGLGSISLGAGSPSSAGSRPASNSSSSEDMRQFKLADVHHSMDQFKPPPSGASRQNGHQIRSPDNFCSSGDSGHSGSVDGRDSNELRGPGGVAPPAEVACPKRQGDTKRSSLVQQQRGKGIENHNPSNVSDGSVWNGRVEVPLKVNSERNTYLATKQIIY